MHLFLLSVFISSASSFLPFSVSFAMLVFLLLFFFVFHHKLFTTLAFFVLNPKLHIYSFNCLHSPSVNPSRANCDNCDIKSISDTVFTVALFLPALVFSQHSRNWIPCSVWKLSEWTHSFTPFPSLYAHASSSYLLITAFCFLLYQPESVNPIMCC